MNTNTFRSITRIGLAAALTLGAVLASGLSASAQYFQPLRAWGVDSNGELGNDDTYFAYRTPQIVNSPGYVADISAGGAHGMMVDIYGTVFTWGDNSAGQLGYEEPYRSTYARRTVGVSNIYTVSAGGNFSLAVRTDNTVWAWGDNHYGELGQGTHDASPGSIQHTTPVQVRNAGGSHPPLSGIVQVSSGSVHCLALTSSGGVYAWGANNSGQLGNGSITQSDYAAPAGIFGVRQVAAGKYHSLALKTDGTVWGWGNNDAGQLGGGVTANRVYPVQVPGINNVVAVATSANCSAALKSDGTVWVWGFFYGTTYASDPPTKIDGLSNIQNIALGQAHLLATDNHDELYVYGINDKGQCGNPSFGSYVYPARKLESLVHINAITAGADFSIVRTYSANIGGQINLQGAVQSLYYQTVGLTFYSAGYAPFTRTVNIYNGIYNFQVNDLPRRNYTVRVKGDKWLARQFSLDLTSSDSNGLYLTLLAGDANNDNVVDISDLLLVIGHYNKKQGDSGYLYAADLNGDATTDIADLLLLISNYNQIGE